MTAIFLPPSDPHELNLVTQWSIVCRCTGIASLAPNRNLNSQDHGCATSIWSLMQRTLGVGSCVRRGWALTELLSVLSRISRIHAQPILERAASLRLKAGGEQKKNLTRSRRRTSPGSPAACILPALRQEEAKRRIRMRADAISQNPGGFHQT